MRKVVSLLTMLMLLCTLVFGQTRTVTGTVRDNQGNPVAFATVTEEGTNNATRADENGRFSINVRENGRLLISAAGHEAQTVTLDAAGSVVLPRSNEQLSEVVVTTAFGIRRAQRITPYSAQVIGEDQLRIIPQTNVNNALAGKVAGVQFRGQSAAKLNDEGFLRIRGGLGINDRGALYVVDGTPVSSFDINPDDIQDVTILKGANATALFGERAAGGAVVITTKKRATAGSSIELNQGLTFDRVYILPRYQDLYAGGSTSELMRYTWEAGHPEEWKALDGAYFHDYTDDASWGPRMFGQQYAPWYAWIPGHADYGKTQPLVAQPDNAREFWETGLTRVSNVAFTRSGQGFNARVSYTNTGIRGLLPNTSSARNNLFTSLSVDVSPRFVLGANINYANNRIEGEFSDAYSNNSTGSFNSWFHRNLDMSKLRELRNLRTPIGTIPSWNMASNPSSGSADDSYRGNYWYNFFTWYEQIDFTQVRDRLFGDASLTYNINDNFRLRTTIRKNAITTSYENITPTIIENSAVQSGTLAEYETGNTRSNEMNYEFLASYNSRFIADKLNVSLNAGGNLLQTKYNDVTQSTAGGLNIADFYAISNSKNTPTLGNNRQQTEVRSFFAFGDLEWARIAAVNFAVRSDSYSTLPNGDNTLISPAAGASLFFSDFTKDALPWLSFGKVFGSWGKKPQSLTVYQNNFGYTLNQNQWDGNYLMTAPNRYIAPGTKGALITTFEAGVDLRFVNNRYGLNVTYYDEKQEDAPLEVPIAGTSGYTTQLLNVGLIKRKGLEFQLTARPMVRRDFTWEINKTFGYLIDNPVIDIGEGDRLRVGGGANFSGGSVQPPAVYQVEGKQWGQLIGGGIRYNDAGLPLINPAMTGGVIYATDPNHSFGSVVPKVTGGLVNTLTYKSFVLNFNLDYQVGGKFFSLSEMWGHYSGLLEATAATNDRGWNVRDEVADGGGVHVIGVDAADGRTPVDMYVDAQTYFHSFFNAQAWDPYVHDLTFVKLREVSLGYQIPVSRFGVRWFKGATASVVARNPWLIWSATRNFDPSEISGIYGENGQLPGTRSIGFNLKLNF